MSITTVAFAQSAGWLTLSDTVPSAGEKISFTYDAAGSPLEKQDSIESMVFFINDKGNPAIDLTLKKKGRLWIGVFTIPEHTRAFSIGLSRNDSVDNNDGRTYSWMVYKDRQPVEDAYGAMATILKTLGPMWMNTRPDFKRLVSLYGKELDRQAADSSRYLRNYISAIFKAKDPVLRAQMPVLVNRLAQSGDEQSMIMASQMYRTARATAVADSLTALIEIRFPNGFSDRNKAYGELRNEHNPEKKEALYKAFIKGFPNSVDEVGSDVAAMAVQYLEAGREVDFHRVSGMVKIKDALAFDLNSYVLRRLEKDGNLDSLAAFSKLSLAMMVDLINNDQAVEYTSHKGKQRYFQKLYDYCASTYSSILYKEERYQEALAYEEPIYTHHGVGDNTETYIKTLQALGQDGKAMHIIETEIRNRNDQEAFDKILHDLYVKTKGSDKGYDDYLGSLRSDADHRIREKLAAEMIRVAAPAFTLKDINGRTVSLADFKGKVVVLDFWATWCGPCKASFPGMQLAVDKYKDNPNVQFLFIDTFEKMKDFESAVREFAADNQYTFHFVLDNMDDEGVQRKVAKSFDTEVIPTKFVIDGEGYIRFKAVGYGGSPTALADEISNMIEMAM